MGKEIKEVYDMVDGIPIWQHLKIGSENSEVKLIPTDYGTFAETIGRRVLCKLTEKGGILDKIFPGITIISVHEIRRKKVVQKKKIEIGDLVLEIDYKDKSQFGKKIVVFEIKYGKAHIYQSQIRKYSFMINSPMEYYPKADELKVFFVMFDKIDTIHYKAYYNISELTKEFAKKIIESIPVGEWNGKFSEYDHISNKIESGMAKLL